MDEQKEVVLFKFEDLALGARFKYQSLNAQKIWIKLSHDGSVAEYDPVRFKQRRWSGQEICYFAGDVEARKQMVVILME